MLMSGAFSCGVGSTVRPVPSVVVAVNVQDEESLVPRRDAVEQVAQHAVIFGMEVERPLHQVRVQLFPCPDLQSPALRRRSIDGVFAAAVEVELEPRAVGDHKLRDAADGFTGEGIFLAKSLILAERHSCRDLGSQLVPVVNRRRDHGSRAVLDSPPASHIKRSLIHSAVALGATFGCEFSMRSGR